MIVKLTEHHLEFLSLKGGGRGSSESTLVKLSNCWKSHATAEIVSVICIISDVPDKQKLSMTSRLRVILRKAIKSIKNLGDNCNLYLKILF